MTSVAKHILGWLKARRTEFSVIGYLIHMTAWFTCLGLSIYWWRAWRHLLDTFEAAASAYKWSEWHGFYWLESLLAVPIQKSQLSNHVIAAIDQEGKLLVVYRWYDPELTVYEVNLSDKSYKLKDHLMIGKEGSGREHISSLASEAPADFSPISEIYFNYDPLVLRCVKQTKDGQIFYDFDMSSG